MTNFNALRSKLTKHAAAILAGKPEESPYWHCPAVEFVEQLRTDKAAYVEATLDPTPLDEEYVRSLGFTIHPKGRSGCLELRLGDYLLLEYQVLTNSVLLGSYRLPITTRGQLVLLLAGLMQGGEG